MVQYRFYNITKKEANKSRTPEWVLEMDVHKDIDNLIELFETIIESNDWSTSDYIVAFKAEDKIFRYKCSTVNDYNPTENEYVFEKQIIEYYKLMDEIKLMNE